MGSGIKIGEEKKTGRLIHWALNQFVTAEGFEELTCDCVGFLTTFFKELNHCHKETVFFINRIQIEQEIINLGGI